MKNKSISFLVALLFITVSASAQKPLIKFGKFSDEELNMTVYAKDSSASAVVLADDCTIKIEYSQNEGFQLHITRLKRIKILKKEGYDWAKFEIDLSKKYDKITKLKATTINGEEKTKLEDSQVYKEDYNKYWDRIKFEMPAVKVGSILDIEYNILSESFYIRDWFFQTEIPTLASQYTVSIPEYYYYKLLEKGFISIGEKNITQAQRRVTITESNRNESGGITRTEQSNYNFDYNETTYYFKSTDVPAFKSEDYMTSKYNYLSCVQFELGSIRWPNKPIKNYTTTWEALNRELLDDSDFGSRIKGHGFLKDDLSVIPMADTLPQNKAIAIYELIRKKMNWNDRNYITSTDPNKAWKDGVGSVADINLLLVAALTQSGLEAYPVILSTRKNGIIHPAQIIIDQFNYVIVVVRLNDKLILLDATDKNIPFGTLPKHCLNGQGRLVNEKGGEWIDLKPTSIYNKSVQADIFIQEDFTLKGNVKEKYDGYAGIETRESLKYFNSDKEFIENQQKQLVSFDMELDSISGKLPVSEPLYINYQFEAKNHIDIAGNLLIFNPLIYGRYKDNPFKLPNREYPVDFAFKHSVTYVTTVNIPEGYQIENLPETKKISLPERAISYTYAAQKTSNKITIITRFDINKTVFLPDEYEDLKTFYNQVLDLQSKQIILKKL